MPSSSQLDRAIIRFRQQLLRRERGAASQMVRVYGEAWRRILAELDKLQEEYERALEGGELRSTWVYERGRLLAFRDQVAHELKSFARYVDQSTRAQIMQAIRDAADHAEQMVMLSLGAPPEGIMLDWNRLPTSAIAEVVGITQPDSPLHESLASISPAGAEAAERALVQGLLMGRSPRAIAPLLRKALGVSLSMALMIARTETIRAYREATRQNYLSNSDVVIGWIWHAKLDERTCAACWAMHGTVHALDEELNDHPNGRCAMVPQTVSWRDIAERRGLSPAPTRETGVQVTPGAVVFAGLPEDRQIRIIGRKRWELWKQGLVEFRDFVSFSRSEKFGVFIRVRSVTDILDKIKGQHTDT